MFRLTLMTYVTILIMSQCDSSPVRRSQQHGELAARRRSPMDTTFIRFGRSPYHDISTYPKTNQHATDRRGDNSFVRFGRNYQPDDIDISKRYPNDFVRLGRNDFLRFGRSSEDQNRNDYEINGELTLLHQLSPETDYNDEEDKRKLKLIQQSQAECLDCY